MNTQTNSQLEPIPAHIRKYGDEAGGDCFTKEDIAALAYELWEQHDGQNGSPVEYWLEAERILRTRVTGAGE